MADDIYIEVGPMSVISGKVPKEYVGSAKKLMCDAAIKKIKKAKGYTPEKKKATKGFQFSATLNSITITTDKGKESVFCEISGVVATWPKKKMLTSKLTNKTGIKGGATKKDVEDCITIAMETVTEKYVVPFLKKQKL